MSRIITKSLCLATRNIRKTQFSPLAPSPKAGLLVFSCPGGEITTDENSVVDPVEMFQKFNTLMRRSYIL